jgi:dihydrofolate synthase/folylpolyglutamate synthase
MTYSEIITHIFQSFPMYHRVGSAAYKEGLENIELLAEMAGHPEKKLQAIHIAGTNGKGSVAHLLSSYFQELGWKTGLFTSPHLIDFRERIKINGKEISEQQVIDFFAKYHKKMTEISPSFFEMTTIFAFDTFVNENVNIAIIETGLGGRLDATNILSPILSVITNISLEHTKMLGDTLSEIAYEKAGIIKESTPIVIGEYHPETFPVFEKIATQRNAPLYLAEEYQGELEFGGIYQRKNLGTFIKCIEVIEAECRRQKAESDEALSPSNFEGVPEGRGSLYQNENTMPEGRGSLYQNENTMPEGWLSEAEAGRGSLFNAIKNLYQNTGFAARWQIISEVPLTICDAAHNPAAIALVMQQLQQLPHHNLHIIIGFANDKDVDTIIPLLPKNANYYACQAQIERAMPSDELATKLSSAKLNVINVPKVINAYNQAHANAKENDVIFIGGSFFIVGEFLQIKKAQTFDLRT